MTVAFVDGLGVKGRELKLTPGGHDRITFKLCAPFAPVSKPPPKKLGSRASFLLLHVQPLPTLMRNDLRTFRCTPIRDTILSCSSRQFVVENCWTQITKVPRFPMCRRRVQILLNGQFTLALVLPHINKSRRITNAVKKKNQMYQNSRQIWNEKKTPKQTEGSCLLFAFFKH